MPQDKKPRVAAYSFDFVTRVHLEDELREKPFFCAPRFADADAWAAAMVDKENVELLLEAGQVEMKIPKDCTAPQLHRWLQKWVSKLKIKDKWIMEVNTAMRNPDQVPHGKASGYLRKAEVHQKVLSQEDCERLVKMLPKTKSSTKRDTAQLDARFTSSCELTERTRSHMKILGMLREIDFESKVKQIVMKATPGLQRNKMSLRAVEEDEVKMKLFINIYEPSPQENVGNGGKKRKRSGVDKEAVSGLETHTYQPDGGWWQPWAILGSGQGSGQG